MTLLSDKSIRALCVNPFPSDEGFKQNCYSDTYKAQCRLDRAAFRPMISPFVDRQVKTRDRLITRTEYDALARNSDSDMSSVVILDNDDIHGAYARMPERIISYGITSYGYDVRLDQKFKIFTNMLGSTIDPLAIHQDCFVEQSSSLNKEGYVILPPNSYLLGVTPETFVMPRDVTAICVGKSTYARCFTGDTKVALANGTSVSFVDMVKRTEEGERFWGYSVDEQGNIQVSELTSPRKIGHEKILKVTLDNGEAIHCTPDHEFIARNGELIEAQHLRENESLMPFYRASVAENYKVVSVECLVETQDVYCLTAPEFGNFALEAGAFVKNCGIAVNVTPIEAGFEGQVVIEVANQTSLPARIYANMGIAQFLFFKGDQPCDVSYADRGGKYQGQSGITDARV